ncbi:hypothetical protein D3C86_1830960 [compost metagenome]
MVSQSIFTMVGAYSNSWIFYFNNNPLIAKSRNPIIEQALSLATSLLEEDTSQGLPEIQSTTGPGNLTKSVTEFLKEKDAIVEELILVLKDWDNTAESKWPLSYRNDARNWRLSNSVNFNG